MSELQGAPTSWKVPVAHDDYDVVF